MFLVLVLPAAAQVEQRGAAHANDESGRPIARSQAQIDEAQAQEREHMQNLRRARAELEARRAEAARGLAARETRAREMARLQGSTSALARRESFLGHDLGWVQRERDSLPWDPADHSSAARRGALDRRLADERPERERADLLLQRETTRLDGLLLRPPR